MQDSLRGLKKKVEQLSSAAESLCTVFSSERTRLERQDQVARFNEFHIAVVRELNAVKSEEESARGYYSKNRDTRRRLGNMIALIGMKTNAIGFVKMSQKLSAPPPNGEPQFGTVLVAIGTEGIPDDVRVMSISKLARESYRTEFDVMKDVQKAGTQLLTEKEFSDLVNKLAQGIIQGRESLPYKLRPVFRIQASYRPVIRKAEPEASSGLGLE